MFSIFKKKKQIEFPTEIVVEECQPCDDEIAEEWSRNCEKHLSDIHGVYAAKWIEGQYLWQVTFSAGEFIREEPFVNYLNEAVFDAISSTEGVSESHHEDTEKYIISGEVNGKLLVENVSKAIDNFATKYLKKWEASIKQT